MISQKSKGLCAKIVFFEFGLMCMYGMHDACGWTTKTTTSGIYGERGGREREYVCMFVVYSYVTEEREIYR